MANLQIIRDLAFSKKIKLAEIAAKCDITQQGLNALINSNSTKVETLEKIAKVLNVPISTFFGEEQAMVADNIAPYGITKIADDELQQENEKLKAKNAELEKQVKVLFEMIDMLQSQIDKIKK